MSNQIAFVNGYPDNSEPPVAAEPSLTGADALRQFIRDGGAVIPILPNRKKPAHKWGQARLTEAELDNLVAMHGTNLNVAICPEDYGWCVIDADLQKPGAREALDALHLPDTFAINTPSGGKHLYFAGSLPPTTGKLGVGIDTRGVGSYVLVPPSSVNGKQYIKANDLEPAPLPPHIPAFLGPPTQARERQGDEPINPEVALAKGRDVLKWCDVSIEGRGGNDNAYRVAARLVRDCGLEPEAALDLLMEPGGWNNRCEPPWAYEDLATIVQNAGNYGQNEPGADLFEFGAPDASVPIEGNEIAAPSIVPTQKPDSEFGSDGLSWRRLSSFQNLEPTFLWQDRIEQDLVVFAGATGSGKSTTVYTIAAYLSVGASYPHGEGRAPKGATVVLSAEDQPQTKILGNVLAAGGDADQVIFLRSMVLDQPKNQQSKRAFCFQKDLERVKARILQEREAGLNIKLFVIDPLSAFMGKANTHVTSEVRGQLLEFVDFLHDLSITAIVILHFNKDALDATNLLKAVSGSGAFVEMPRCVVMFLPHPEQGWEQAPGDIRRGVFFSAKVSNGKPAQKLYYELPTVLLPSDSLDEYGNRKLVERVYTKFGDYCPLSTAEIIQGANSVGHELINLGKQDQAETFLNNALADGEPHLIDDVKREAKNAGVHFRALERAREAMGARILTVRSRWWQIPRNRMPVTSDVDADLHS